MSSTIKARANNHAKEASKFLYSHIFDIVDELSFTKKQEKEILRDMGMSALISKGQQRRDNMIASLRNAIEATAGSVGTSAVMRQWQEALDWRTSLFLKAVYEEDVEEVGRAAYEYNEMLKLWRTTSPFTKNDDGSLPQMDFQSNDHDVLHAFNSHIVNMLKSKSYTHILLHKPLIWENNFSSIELSHNRPDWYIQPAPDPQSDGFDEQSSKETISAKDILLSRYVSMSCDFNTALGNARWNPEGYQSDYYAVVSGVFPIEALVSVPTLGIGRLANMECVVDTKLIKSGSFSALFGRKAVM